MIPPDDVEDFIDLRNELRDRIDDIVSEFIYPPSACLAVFLEIAAHIHIACKTPSADINSYLSICHHFYKQAQFLVDSIPPD